MGKEHVPLIRWNFCMPLFRAAPIVVSTDQETELLRLARAHKTPRKRAERAEMILRSAAGTEVREIARQLGVWPKTVRYWRARWQAGAAETPVADRLSDAAREGAPAMFSPEQVCAIVALACERPEDIPCIRGRVQPSLVSVLNNPQEANMRKTSLRYRETTVGHADFLERDGFEPEVSLAVLPKTQSELPFGWASPTVAIASLI